jgi:hypothetical protein
MADAGPYRNAQGDEPRQGAGLPHRRVGLRRDTRVCLIGISFFAKSEQQAASAPTLKAGLPVATSDGGYVIMR